MAKAKQAIPEGFHTVTAQLILEDAASTIDWSKSLSGRGKIARPLASMA